MMVVTVVLLFLECCIGQSEMPTKIFVGRLAEGTTSEDIGSLFRKFGHVTECDVISNFGFVVSTAINVTYCFEGLLLTSPYYILSWILHRIW